MSSRCMAVILLCGLVVREESRRRCSHGRTAVRGVMTKEKGIKLCKQIAACQRLIIKSA